VSAPGARLRPGNWVLRHLQVALGSLGCLLRRPLGSLMTVWVLGIALALPAGLLVLLANLQQLASRWDGPATVSLFLRQEVTEAGAAALARAIGAREAATVTLVTRDAALAELRAHGGFGAALDALDSNPLPIVLLVRPPAGGGSAGAAALTERLRQLPEVEWALLDLKWVQRLQGIAAFARRGTYLIAGLLGLAVLLIVGNTIRLEIQGRHEEIAIAKLVGATDACVRRPFLYQGWWLGLFGGCTAWLLVAAAVIALDAPAARLAALYQSGFRLLGPTSLESAGLLAAGALTGWLGAWVAVGRHLRAVEPE
jgi:cell division transport system permease protein